MTNPTFEELRLSGKLPSPAGVGMRVLQVTRSEDFSVEELGEVIRGDAALTGRILKFANSAAMSGQEPLVDVRDAIMRLGSSTVRDLSLAFSLASDRSRREASNFDYPHYWSYSLARAICMQAAAVLTNKWDPSAGFLCGLLGGIGQLALVSVFGDRYTELLSSKQSAGHAGLIAAEEEEFGLDQADAGLCLLADWGLPEDLCEAVRDFGKTRSLRGAQLAESGVVKQVNQVRVGEVMASLLVMSSEEVEASSGWVTDQLQESLALLELDTQAFAVLLSDCNREWQAWSKELGLPVAQEEDPLQFEQRMDHLRQRAGAAADLPAPHFAGRTRGDTRMSTSGRIRVLIVDDDPSSLRQTSALLEQSGFEALRAYSGREALEATLSLSPDMVIADWDMPDLNGKDLCCALRRTEGGSRIYFLILTQNADEEQLVHAFDAGVDDALSKPVSPRLLTARIKAGERFVRMQRKIDIDKQVMLRQVAELGVLNRRLRATSLTDPLTELPNRRFAMKRLASEWATAERTGRGLAVAIIDIDHFKTINDTYGHGAGDSVLVRVSEILKDCIRVNDDVCRIGGEEFMLICRGISEEKCIIVAERIRTRVAECVMNTGGFQGSITLSLGLAAFSPEIENYDALIKCADRALYAAKEQGRNRIVRFSELHKRQERA